MRKIVVLPALILILSWLCPDPSYAAHLALNQAIQHALSKNSTVLKLVADYKSLLSQTLSSKGIYDWQVEARLNYSDADQTQTVIFQPSNIKQTEFNVGGGKTFTTGTTFGIDSSIIRTKDNSTFNIFNTRYDSELGISLSQSLLEGFIGLPDRVFETTNKKRLTAMRLSIWRELELVAGSVSQKYWDLWRDIQLQNISKLSEDEALVFFNETKRLNKIGLREKDEILQAETAWLERQQEYLFSQNRTQRDWLTLKNELDFLGNPTWFEIPELDSPIWGNMDDHSNVLKEAYHNRADLISLQMNQEIHQRIRRSLSGLSLPKLTASGGYSLLGLDPELSKSMDQIEKTRVTGWNVGMSLRHSFGQNSDYAELIKSESNFLQSQSSYRKRLDRIESEVKILVRQLKLNQNLLKLSIKIEDRKTEIQSLLREKFGQGRISIQELLRTQEELRQARALRQRAETNMILSQLDIDLAKGTYLKSKGYSQQNVDDIITPKR